MARPKLTHAISWDDFCEEAVAVFRAALILLANEASLPRNETSINLVLFKLAHGVHTLRLQSAASSINFSIIFNGTNQPLSDEEADDPRLRKMPDFFCVIKDSSIAEPLLSQVYYYLECKRLGQAEKGWVLNSNYSEHGIRRFIDATWGYAKGCPSGTMIGYLQSLTPSTILSEVNTGVGALSLPALSVRGNWVNRGLSEVDQAVLSRPFAPQSFRLDHLWIDIRHCPQTDPVARPPTRPSKAKQGRKKTAVGTRLVSKKTGSRKSIKPVSTP